MEPTSWSTFVTTLTVGLSLVLIVSAADIALFHPDPVRRADGYLVLKLLLATCGGGGLLATALQRLTGG